MLNSIIGIIGMCFILAGFFLEDSGKLNRKDYKYQIINLSGASLLFYYSYTLNSVVFMILNAVWAAVALYYLMKYRTQKGL